VVWKHVRVTGDGDNPWFGLVGGLLVAAIGALQAVRSVTVRPEVRSDRPVSFWSMRDHPLAARWIGVVNIVAGAGVALFSFSLR
jgi:hypothetical protein